MPFPLSKYTSQKSLSTLDLSPSVPDLSVPPLQPAYSNFTQTNNSETIPKINTEVHKYNSNEPRARESHRPHSAHDGSGYFASRTPYPRLPIASEVSRVPGSSEGSEPSESSEIVEISDSNVPQTNQMPHLPRGHHVPSAPPVPNHTSYPQSSPYSPAPSYASQQSYMSLPSYQSYPRTSGSASASGSGQPVLAVQVPQIPIHQTQSQSQSQTKFQPQSTVPRRSATTPSLQPQRSFQPQGRQTSFTALTAAGRAIPPKPIILPLKTPKTPTDRTTATILTASSRRPAVYPALLSKVAEKLKDTLPVGDRKKNGLNYRDAFLGSEAVDTIASIIRTNDRNLALLLGRALDAQRFFHDVTYQHRLRDSPVEVYQFNHVVDPQGPGPAFVPVNGVFTLLAECYSPTCTRSTLCYSIACPRRLEQQARTSLTRAVSRASLLQDEAPREAWSKTVAPSVLSACDKREIQRQEAIYETIYTERDYVKDLEYIRDVFVPEIRLCTALAERERERFIRNVFCGVQDVLSVNSQLAEALTRRQKQAPIVHQIGDIFLEFFPKFGPYIKHGAGWPYAAYEFKRVVSTNAAFARLVQKLENLKESRRRKFESFFTEPTTRAPRYPLLLERILKNTPAEHPDYEQLKAAVKYIREHILAAMNARTGEAMDRLELFKFEQKLVFGPDLTAVNLRLGARERRIKHKGSLRKKFQDKDNQGEVCYYLLDHVLLLYRRKIVAKQERFRVQQRPMPLPLLFVSDSEDPVPRSILSAHDATRHTVRRPPGPDAAAGKFPLTFTCLGRRGYEQTLYASGLSAQRGLIDAIEAQQRESRAAHDVFALVKVADRFLDMRNGVTCVVPFDSGRKLLFGTDDGVFVCDKKTTETGKVWLSAPNKLIARPNVSKLCVLEEYQALLALVDKKLYFWSTDLLDPRDSTGNARKGRELMNHVSFFECGICDGKMYICSAKTSGHIIRVFEFEDMTGNLKKRGKMKPGSKDISLNSEPVSVSFLRSKLCIGCTKGFEIVVVETRTMESLLDPADTSLDFVARKEGLKPLAIYRLGREFLLNYSDFSFFVNKNGWRVKPNWIIYWEGLPQNFVLFHPYIIAFESSFIEIRDVESGELVRAITGDNIRLLHANSQDIYYAYTDELGYDQVVCLDFWSAFRRKHEDSREEKQIEG